MSGGKLSLMKKLILLFLLIPNLVMAASFDCDKASTKHEKMICDGQKYYEAAIRRYSTMKDEDMGVGESSKKVVEELKAAHQSFVSFRESFCGAAYSQAGGTRRNNVYENCVEVLTQRYTYQLWDQFLSDRAGREIPGYPRKPKITYEVLL